jgi:hypothetical protein
MKLFPGISNPEFVNKEYRWEEHCCKVEKYMQVIDFPQHTKQ